MFFDHGKCLITIRATVATSGYFAGDVLSPLDLLSYEPAYEKAMHRAFGSTLFVRTEAAATALATRFGLASVDLEGRVSRPGSLQVGWPEGRVISRCCCPQCGRRALRCLHACRCT